MAEQRIRLRVPLEATDQRNGRITLHSFTYDEQGLFHAIDGVRCARLACDDGGRITEELAYGENGAIGGHLYTYDQRGLMTEWTDLSPTHRYVSRYTYDENGHPAEEWLYLDNKLLEHGVIVCDGDGNVTEEISYDAEGQVTSRVTSVYDAAGRKLSEVDSLPDGEPDNRFSFSYDEEGRLTEMRSSGRFGDTTFRYSYLCQGNRVEWRQEQPDGSVRSRIRTYDDSGVRVEEEHTGRITEEIWMAGELLVSRIAYTYDAEGRKTEIREYGENGQLLQRVVRAYDGAGTLVSRREETGDGSVRRSIEVTAWSEVEVTKERATFLQEKLATVYGYVVLGLPKNG